MGSKAEYEAKRAAQKAARQTSQKGLVRRDAELFVKMFEQFIEAKVTSENVEEKRTELVNMLCGDSLPAA